MLRHLLWTIPVMPFAGFLILALFGKTLSRKWTAGIGVGSVGLSALAAVLVSLEFMAAGPDTASFSQTLWTWFAIAGFSPSMSLYLDAPSVVMILVIAGIAFLIHLYSAAFMAADEDYSRFFAYMNLFVGSMLILVLAGDLLFLYLGWEGVGLCSYLLIGFWYKDPANVRAADKAFIVTRIGDASLAIGFILLFIHMGTPDIGIILQKLPQTWATGDPLAVAAAALLLGGAVGKSAQLPLQVWLPDAMAGPTPVSALIHAATMVTAGVYLIIRMHPLFLAAPPVLAATAIIGAIGILIAAVSALTQRDIKRALAYSTISQIGYMFLALGVGAWSAALFHFMTHACFKALLFLCAGVIIQSLGEEHDIFKMGGLRTRLPVIFWPFLVGVASLSAVPLITAGFYSKDLILYLSWTSVAGRPWLWLAGLAGALITALYAFRILFRVFFGAAPAYPDFPDKGPSRLQTVPLFILAVLAVISGFVQMPGELGGYSLFTRFLNKSLPAAPVQAMSPLLSTVLFITAAMIPLIGIAMAYHFFRRSQREADHQVKTRTSSDLHRFWQSGWGFDRLYELTIIKPFLQFARINRGDFIDLFYNGLAGCCIALNQILVLTQSGRVRRYAAVLAAGIIVMIGIALIVNSKW